MNNNVFVSSGHSINGRQKKNASGIQGNNRRNGRKDIGRFPFVEGMRSRIQAAIRENQAIT